MAILTEPKSEEKNGIVFFEEPWDISTTDWFSLHDESDFVADGLDNNMVRIYCYAKNGFYNAELERLLNHCIHKKSYITEWVFHSWEYKYA